MQENKLLNKTLQILDKKGSKEAYGYISSNMDCLDDLSSQVYNFLYCLAAASNKKGEALNWLNRAIIKNKMWYRPEVFYDEDLNSIRQEELFTKLLKISNKRYFEALKETTTVISWKKRTHDSIMLCLHGNQQNNDMNQEYWNCFKNGNLQVEYLQSGEIDSYQLFRWEDDGTGSKQLKKTIAQMDWYSYQTRILSGFSSGCNVILKAILEEEISCEKIILQSPWIPIIEKYGDLVVKKIKKLNIQVLMVCGDEDLDCFPLCKSFLKLAEGNDLKIGVDIITGLNHDYPENFQEIVTRFI